MSFSKTVTFLGRALCIRSDGNSITALSVGTPQEEHPCPLLDNAAHQLHEYELGTRKAFSLPLAPQGTVFQQKVWAALCTIPYGQTRSYGELARQIGHPKAARAVGMACNRNPILLLIPCHRVIGASGDLTGYAAGLDLKAQLLNLEQTTITTETSVL